MDQNHLITALSLLEHPETYPGLVSRKDPKVLLRVWRYPSFDTSYSWAIIESEREYFLRRIVWDQALSHHVLSFNRPITYGCETPFEKAIYDKILAELKEIRIAPFAAEELLGLDGTSYGIARDNFSASVSVRWWESGPTGWADLQRWHRKIAEVFDSALPTSTVTLTPPEERLR